MNSEPAVITTSIVALVTAGLALITAFGGDITQDQSAAVLGFVSALIALSGPVIRQFVFSKDTTQQLVNKAEEAGLKDAPAPVVQP